MPNDSIKITKVGKELRNKLETLHKQNKAAEMAQLIITIFEEYGNSAKLQNNEEDPDVEEKDAVLKDFLDDLTRTLPAKAEYELDKDGKHIPYRCEIVPENCNFVSSLIFEMNKIFYDKVYDNGKQREDWEKQIRNGKIEDTELIKDEPDIVQKLAHAIVLEVDSAANTTMDAYRVLFSKIHNKRIDGKPGTEVWNAKAKNTFRDVCHDKNISDKMLKNYEKKFSDRNPSKSIGYKVTPGGPTEEKELFAELPDYLEEVRKYKTEAEFEAREEELYKKIDNFERYVQRVKSGVKVGKVLYDRITDIYKAPEPKPDQDSAESKPNQDAAKSKPNQDAAESKPNQDAAESKLKPDHDTAESIKYLELFNHLGTDYVYQGKGATDDIGYINVEDATENIENCIEDSKATTLKVFNAHKKNGTINTPEGQKSYRIAKTMEDIGMLNALVRKRTLEEKELKLSSLKISGFKNEIYFLNKQRRQLGLFGAHKLPEDEFTKSLDNLADEISDSIIADGRDPQCFDDLIISLKQYKRTYQKMRVAEKEGNPDEYKKYRNLLNEKSAQTQNYISECKKFENNDEIEKLNLTENVKDRTDLYKTISKTVTRKFDKTPINYDSYIYLHTGKNAGSTDKERRMNMAKVLAAYTMQKLGKDFDVHKIHETAKGIAKIYRLYENDSPLYGEHLKKALKNKQTALNAGEKIRGQLYGIKDNQYDAYVNDMKELKNVLRSYEGRSTEYKALVKAITAASNLNQDTSTLSPEKKEAQFRYTNLNLIVAVQNYTKGKEKVRITDKGNDAFNHSMDALSIISKYTKGKNQPTNKMIQDVVNNINKIRKDPKLSSYKNFEQNFGTNRIQNAKLEMSDTASAKSAGEIRPKKLPKM